MPHDILAHPDRLAALRATALLDSPPEERFDRLTRLAARVLDAPIALVSLVDDERQFFKSCVGLPEPLASLRQTPLSHSFCKQAVVSGQPLLVNDARQDPLFSDNPSVREFAVIAYAGIPLTTADGAVIGSFCVIDHKPRRWTDADVANLADLAASVATEIDLTRSLKALSESEDRLRVALSASEVGLWQWNVRTGDVVWTDQVEAQLGLPPRSPAGYDVWRDLLHSEDRAGTEANLARCVETGQAFNAEYRVVHPDGEVRWINAKGHPFKNAEGEVERFAGATVDVTDRKRDEVSLRGALAAAEAANKAKDRFLAVLSHELRTPLSPALMIATSMAADPRLPAGVREDAQTIQRNIELETRLIDDLLDVTRIENGKLALKKEPAGPGVGPDRLRRHGAAADASRRGRRPARPVGGGHGRAGGRGPAAAGVQQPPPQRDQVHPPRGLRRDHGAAGGLRRRRTSCRGVGRRHRHRHRAARAAQHLQPLRARGPGDHQRVFGPRFRAGDQQGPRRAHGGSIHAFSAGRGLGTTVTVELPTVAAAGHRTPAVPTRSRAGANGLDILLVDDHADTLRAMSRLLKGLRHRVITANCVAAALKAADHQRFDLLISDIGLPDGTGLDLIQQLMARHPIKGIALTGYGMEADVEKSQAAGFLRAPHQTHQLPTRRRSHSSTCRAGKSINIWIVLNCFPVRYLRFRRPLILRRNLGIAIVYFVSIQY